MRLRVLSPLSQSRRSTHSKKILLLGWVRSIAVVCDVYVVLIAPRLYRLVSYDNMTAIEEITKMEIDLTPAVSLFP
jgi:hypothetical protein